MPFSIAALRPTGRGVYLSPKKVLDRHSFPR
jgi:hypothetical protein